MNEIKRILLEDSNSPKRAWYELRLYQIEDGFLIHKDSGTAGRLLNSETWFRKSLPEAEAKYSSIVRQKTNSARKSPRHYRVVNQLPLPSSAA